MPADFSPDAPSLKSWIEDFQQGHDEARAARGSQPSHQVSRSMRWPWAMLVMIIFIFAFTGNGPRAPSSSPALPAVATAPAVTAPSEPRRISLVSDQAAQFQARVGFTGPNGQQGQERCLVDTGAEVLSINQALARRVGFSPSHLDYSIPMQTANGVTYDALVTLPSLSIEGRLKLRDVPTHVSSQDDGICLMGMSVLKLLRVAINNGSMELSW
jgi:aspartyl protease family protein